MKKVQSHLAPRLPTEGGGGCDGVGHAKGIPPDGALHNANHKPNDNHKCNNPHPRTVPSATTTLRVTKKPVGRSISMALCPRANINPATQSPSGSANATGAAQTQLDRQPPLNRRNASSNSGVGAAGSKRVVAFQTQQQVRRITRLQDLSPEEILAVWFTSLECHEMKQQAAAVAAAWETELTAVAGGESDGNSGEAADHIFAEARGVETLTQEGAWKAYKARRDLYNLVLDEQEEQKRRNVTDHLQIATLAAKESETAVREAQARAKRDHKEAKRCWKSESLRPGKMPRKRMAVVSDIDDPQDHNQKHQQHHQNDDHSDNRDDYTTKKKTSKTFNHGNPPATLETHAEQSTVASMPQTPPIIPSSAHHSQQHPEGEGDPLRSSNGMASSMVTSSAMDRDALTTFELGTGNSESVPIKGKEDADTCDTSDSSPASSDIEHEGADFAPPLHEGEPTTFSRPIASPEGKEMLSLQKSLSVPTFGTSDDGRRVDARFKQRSDSFSPRRPTFIRQISKIRLSPHLKVNRLAITAPALLYTPSPSRKQQVTFSDQTNIHYVIECLREMSGEDILQSWFSSEEIAERKREAMASAAAIDSGYTDVDSRGLEPETEEGRWLCFKAKKNAYDTVLGEIDERKQKGEPIDWGIIASMYSEVTEEARIEAVNRAKIDADEAKAYLTASSTIEEKGTVVAEEGGKETTKKSSRKKVDKKDPKVALDEKKKSKESKPIDKNGAAMKKTKHKEKATKKHDRPKSRAKHRDDSSRNPSFLENSSNVDLTKEKSDSKAKCSMIESQSPVESVNSPVLLDAISPSHKMDPDDTGNHATNEDSTTNLTMARNVDNCVDQDSDPQVRSGTASQNRMMPSTACAVQHDVNKSTNTAYPRIVCSRSSVKLFPGPSAIKNGLVVPNTCRPPPVDATSESIGKLQTAPSALGEHTVLNVQLGATRSEAADHGTETSTVSQKQIERGRDVSRTNPAPAPDSSQTICEPDRDVSRKKLGVTGEPHTSSRTQAERGRSSRRFVGPGQFLRSLSPMKRTRPKTNAAEHCPPSFPTRGRSSMKTPVKALERSQSYSLGSSSDPPATNPKASYRGISPIRFRRPTTTSQNKTEDKRPSRPSAGSDSNVRARSPSPNRRLSFPSQSKNTNNLVRHSTGRSSTMCHVPVAGSDRAQQKQPEGDVKHRLNVSSRGSVKKERSNSVIESETPRKYTGLFKIPDSFKTPEESAKTGDELLTRETRGTGETSCQLTSESARNHNDSDTAPPNVTRRSSIMRFFGKKNAASGLVGE